MSTVELSPEVWRAYARLARRNPRGAPTRSYSPRVLMIVRWLAFRPGSTAELITRVQDQPMTETAARLVRLAKLGLVRWTRTARWERGEDGRFRRQHDDLRWWLTRDGRAFLDLIEREVIV